MSTTVRLSPSDKAMVLVRVQAISKIYLDTCPDLSVKVSYKSLKDNFEITKEWYSSFSKSSNLEITVNEFTDKKMKQCFCDLLTEYFYKELCLEINECIEDNNPKDKHYIFAE